MRRRVSFLEHARERLFTPIATVEPAARRGGGWWGWREEEGK